MSDFWTIIANIINNFYSDFILGHKEALFGVGISSGNSIINTILILARAFIGEQKCTTKELDYVKFINFSREQLRTIHQISILKNKENKFLDDWDEILNFVMVNI